MRIVIAVLVFALAAPIGAQAGRKVLGLQWSELPAQITGKNVRAVLTDGVRLGGDAPHRCKPSRWLSR